jgi:transposase
MASAALHGDDTPVAVLAPGSGRTKTGRFWVYVRDERPHRGKRPPAAVFFYSPDRTAERPLAHLKDFTGVLHADGYAGFKGLYEIGRKPGPIVEAACWAHARRKFHDVHAANGSAIARQALERIGELYRIEEQIRGQPPDKRRRRRQARSLPIAEDLKSWAQATLAKLSGRSELAKAFRYMLARWTVLIRCFADGRLEIDNNPAERALRGVAVGRKNYLFAGSDRGGERAAAIYSLIETAKLNGLDPQAWLRDVLERIADHPNNRIGELLPWNWSPATPAAEAA